MKAVIYDIATGRIDRMFTGEEDVLSLQPSASEQWIEVSSEVDDSTYYVDSGIVTPKQDYTLESLPMPCTLTIEGVEYHCTEQPTFSFTPAGDYEIEVDAGVQHLKKTFTYTQV